MRRPTIEEAVAFLRGCLTREYRRACLRHWRERFGATFADKVERETKRNWKAGRGDVLA